MLNDYWDQYVAIVNTAHANLHSYDMQLESGVISSEQHDSLVISTHYLAESLIKNLRSQLG